MQPAPDERTIERTLLIDADDTLWENNIFYLSCQARFQDYMERWGCNRELAAETLHLCELETIPAYGYGPQGYIAALGISAERLLKLRNLPVTPEIIYEARAIGDLVLSPPMILLGNVEHTLRALRPTSRLVLLTKGQEETQRAKLERSGLEPLFDACYIVQEKDVTTYQNVICELGVRPRDTWMIGNSPKSDINPAVAAGLNAILIPHAHTWTAEIQDIEQPEAVVTLCRFAELADFFEVDPLL
ncbi:MAG: HAD family hydrolase [Chloroflexi bacterium]|jgi:putative hydrolase of the HAD superfamily|nr:HAD family hydrolase [Chloroflexota bacterium]